ncbi:MAG: hypothetical protein II815_07645 [Bacteroidales bacterium]|jgi:hypothetical protein|nr:hypothetical protein [Bacteroidales bacterium]
MAFFLWIFQFISPIALILGGLYLVENPSPLALGLGGVAAVLGLIVGIVGWGDTVPPRWFWIKSSMDLAGSRFLTAIGYALQFFFIPPCIIGLIEYFG